MKALLRDAEGARGNEHLLGRRLLHHGNVAVDGFFSNVKPALAPLRVQGLGCEHAKGAFVQVVVQVRLQAPGRRRNGEQQCVLRLFAVWPIAAEPGNIDIAVDRKHEGEIKVNDQRGILFT